MEASESFETDVEAESFIQHHELQHGVRYTIRKSKFVGLTRVSSLAGYRILFEDKDSSRNTIPINYDGTPFIIIGCDLRECHHGPARTKSKKQSESHLTDHDFGQPSRRHLQVTKKMNCLAKVKLRRIIKFPDYKIKGPDSRWKRRQLSNKLREEFRETTNQEYGVMVQCFGSHENHLTGKYAGYSNRLDQRVIKMIKTCAAEGVVNVTDVQRRCRQFVEENIKDDSLVSTDRRFHPKRKEIYNHVYNTVIDTRSNIDDQLSVAGMVDEWKANLEDGDSLYFRPMSPRNSTQQLCMHSDVDIHRRHHEFVRMPLLVFQREKRRHMFGLKHFDEEVIDSVLQRMIDELWLTKPDKRYPATGLPISFIKGLQDTSSLLKIFEYRKQMAMYYLLYVLLKQYLVNMLAKLTGNECKWADSECIETEVDMMEIIRQSRINQK